MNVAMEHGFKKAEAYDLVANEMWGMNAKY
jgi:hypothetical protein